MFGRNWRGSLLDRDLLHGLLPLTKDNTEYRPQALPTYLYKEEDDEEITMRKDVMVSYFRGSSW